MRRHIRRSPYLYLLALLSCLLYTAFYTARAIRQDYTAVPVWDSWRFVQYVDELVRFDLRHFWLQHNEHRIVFPEIVYALDYILFRGLQLLPIACNIGCQCLQMSIMWWLLKQMREMPLSFRLTLAACCGLFMTSAMQVQGIEGPLLLQWYLSQSAAMLSLLFLWRSAEKGRWTGLALCVGTAEVVTYSSGNGMALWPVLVTMAILLHLPRRRIAGLAIAGVLSIAAYFVGYRFVGHGRVDLLLAHPFYAIWFTGVFLGTPVSYISPRWGGAAGLAGLLLVIAAVTIAVRQGRTRDPVLVVTVGVCFFVAASALMIAYGRMEPGDANFGTAQAARYVSVPLAYWANLTIALGWLTLRLPWRRDLGLHLLAIALVAVLIVTVMARQDSYERAFAAQQASAHEAGTALLSGIQDADVIRTIFPFPGFVLDHLPRIRQRRLSIFVSGRQDWIGRPLGQMFLAVAADRCSGALKGLSMVAGGYRVTGWAIDRGPDRPPQDIVLTNELGTIVGLGETRRGGYPRVREQGPLSPSDWTGFARTDRMSCPIQAYAIVDKGKAACPIGELQ